MSLFLVKLVGDEEIEVNQEQADAIKLAIESGAASITIGDAWIRSTGIMSITPSQRDHPKYRLWIREKGNGYRSSFETFLDEINYRRTKQKQLPKGEYGAAA